MLWEPRTEFFNHIGDSRRGSSRTCVLHRDLKLQVGASQDEGRQECSRPEDLCRKEWRLGITLEETRAGGCSFFDLGGYGRPSCICLTSGRLPLPWPGDGWPEEAPLV